jgi:hypothetical protein
VARHDRAEPVPALLVGGEHAAQVARRLDAWLLDVVEAVLVGLPDVDRGTRQRLTVRAGHLPGHQAGRALAVQRDVVPEFPRRRLDHVERPEHGRLGRGASGPVVDRLDQHGHPEHVGQQDELLPHVVAHVTGAGEEVDGYAPLLLGQLDVLDEVVQVAHQRRHDLLEPGVRRPLEARRDHLGRTLLGEQLAAHARSSTVRRAASSAASASAWDAAAECRKAT